MGWVGPPDPLPSPRGAAVGPSGAPWGREVLSHRRKIPKLTPPPEKWVPKPPQLGSTPSVGGETLQSLKNTSHRSNKNTMAFARNTSSIVPLLFDVCCTDFFVCEIEGSVSLLNWIMAWLKPKGLYCNVQGASQRLLLGFDSLI